VLNFNIYLYIFYSVITSNNNHEKKIINLINGQFDRDYFSDLLSINKNNIKNLSISLLQKRMNSIFSCKISFHGNTSNRKFIIKVYPSNFYENIEREIECSKLLSSMSISVPRIYDCSKENEKFKWILMDYIEKDDKSFSKILTAIKDCSYVHYSSINLWKDCLNELNSSAHN